MMRCVVTVAGTLDQCVIESEAPPGRGFGAAALAMSKSFQMRPMLIDGAPREGAHVTIPIEWEAGQESAAMQGTLNVLGNPTWSAAPTRAEVLASYPARAAGRAGRVVMRCGFETDGKIDDCDAVSENPPNLGFRAAARSLIRDFRIVADPKLDRYGNTRVDVPFEFFDPANPGPPATLYDPRWVRALDPDLLRKLYPDAAVKAGVVEGQATVDCTAEHDGGLTACLVVAETPAGLGFGDAAIKAAGAMKMSVWTLQGTPVDGTHIQLPIHFVWAATPASP